MQHSKSIVSVVSDEAAMDYPRKPPFNPPEIFPEHAPGIETDPGNRIYPLVREALHLVGLDSGHFGTEKWNPMGDVIAPGETVLIKPNFVKHYHPDGGDTVLSTLTHGSVLRPLMDYALMALKGEGVLIIADTPLEKSDFEEITRVNGVSETVSYLKKKQPVPIELIDLRDSRTFVKIDRSITKEPQPGDPRGYTWIDLGKDSELAELDSEQTNYHTLGDHSVDHLDPKDIGRGMPNEFHKPGQHRYSIGNTILQADVIISVPKLKTHKKAGVTLNLKNMIGIAHGKEVIPHHRSGKPPAGDSYPEMPPQGYLFKRKVKMGMLRILTRSEVLEKSARFIVRDALGIPYRHSEKKPVEWGDWYGNDTIWRTILDLNRILVYADKSGFMRDNPQRRYLSVIDGIIGQEGEGPMSGTPKSCGVVLAGTDPLATDVIGATVMGFDIQKIRQLCNASSQGRERFRLGENRLDHIDVRTNSEDVPQFHFTPPPGWVGHIES